MSGGERQTYSISGMSCEHCVAAVSAVDVDLTSGAVVVSGNGVDGEAVRVAVEAAGYGLAEHA